MSDEKQLEDLLTPYHEIIQIESNKIYLGNQTAVGAPPDIWNYNEENIEEISNLLKRLNIKTIICCADNICKFPNDFTYYQIPARDTPKFNYNDYFDIVADNINNSLKNGNVIIHCNAGVSRSATALIAYLIKYQNMNLDDAINHVKSKRSCIDITNFYDQLKKFKDI